MTRPEQTRKSRKPPRHRPDPSPPSVLQNGKANCSVSGWTRAEQALITNRGRRSRDHSFSRFYHRVRIPFRRSRFNPVLRPETGDSPRTVSTGESPLERRGSTVFFLATRECPTISSSEYTWRNGGERRDNLHRDHSHIQPSHPKPLPVPILHPLMDSLLLRRMAVIGVGVVVFVLLFERRRQRKWVLGGL